MSAITTHVLDTAHGRPAAGLAVVLEVAAGEGWRELGRGVTDPDGRARALLPAGQVPAAGAHRLRFATGPWFEAQGVAAFFPEVVLVFTVADPAQHHHVPLLLAPFGYSTYRGS